MSSRVEAKQRLRDERIARERVRDEKERRTRRIWSLAAVGGVAALVVVALIAVSQSGGGGGGGATAQPTANVRPLFAGIPQSGVTLGRANAPLTMVEYVDLQCPFCRQYTENVMPTVVRRYVRTGKLRIQLRTLAFIGSDSERAAAAASAAAKQNRLWQFADLFYLNQGQENSGYVTDAFVRRIAAGSGVSPAAAVAAANSGATVPAMPAGIDSTPSFLLGPTGGTLKKLDVASLTPGAFTGPLDQALAR